MNGQKAVIWDFNGTILDDFPLCLEVINQMLSRRRLPLLTADDYLSAFDFPVQNYYAQVGFDFSVEPFPILAREYMAHYQPQSFACPLRPGAVATLAALQAGGFQQFLLSASKIEFLTDQLLHFGLTGYFEEIVGQKDILGQSKLETARRWFSQHALNPGQVLLIGDTTHDHKIAADLGCSCILLSGGHNSKQRLAGTGASVFSELSADSIVKF